MMNNQTELMFFDGAESQIKLSSVSVFNWGSFNGLHTMNINPEGTLITGENGSGKSTIIDALMTLLRPAGKVSYNIAAAQDQKKDRSLLSYMRGSFGSKISDGEQVSKDLRADATISVIKAVYENLSKTNKVVLLGVFYITSSSNVYSDVKKIYSISPTDIDIKEMLSRFNNQDVRALKDYLRAVPGCRVCDDNFGEYETHFRHQLMMDNVNAPALLSRALGLKKIDDLTVLIRTLVLEPGTVKEDAVNTISQFDDLKAIHARLEDAREQEKKLSPLVDHVEKYEKNKSQTEQYEKAGSLSDIFINTFAKDFYKKKLEELSYEYDNDLSVYNSLQVKRKEAEANKELCHTNLIKGGGDRAEQVKQQIAQKEIALVNVQEKFNRYDTVCAALNLKKAVSQEDFIFNKKEIENIENTIKEQKDSIDENIFAQGSIFHKLKEDRANNQQELTELLKHSDSNLPTAYIKLKESICSDLQISHDNIIYVAQLIEVNKEFKEWHGAIERALGGVRHTLLVTRDDYPLITKWVNSRYLGLHVRIQIADETSSVPNSFGNKGFLIKLNFKAHKFTNWLKQYLQRFDLICADSVDELNKTEFSMTKEGLIHKSNGYFEKKDIAKIDDRREWCLGFSNRERIELLKADIQNLDNEIKLYESRVSKLREEKSKLDNNSLACKRLKEVSSFSEIDVASIQTQIAELKELLESLLNNPDIAKLQKLYDESVNALNDLDSRISGYNRKLGALEKELNEYKEKIGQIENSTTVSIDEDTYKLLEKTMLKLKFDKDTIFVGDHPVQFRNELSNRLKDANEKVTVARSAISSIVSTFHSSWPVASADFGSEFSSYPSYVDYLNKIKAEGLPKLVEEFKAKLNTEVTQSVACIVQKMDRELTLIKDRIDKINVVLKRAEFMENAYLSIEPKKISNSTLKDFYNDTKKVMNMLSLEDHELRYKAISKVIDTLSAALNSNAQEMKTILDPRLRMQFLANVIDKRTGEINDTLNSSSGKSGGEKESFAGSVLAASLAYVLTPEGNSMPVYSTVFLDEAFSNTSDKVSQRVLKIFKELGLHVNLITPLKNVELARDYAKSLILMERDTQTHSSSMCEVSWEEYDAQQNEQKEDELKDLGISIESSN